MASERVYREQKILSKFLEVDCVETFLEIDLATKKNEFRPVLRRRAHSATRNMYNLWFMHRANVEPKFLAQYTASIFSVRQPNAAIWGQANYGLGYCWNPTNDATASYGIQVGSTDTAFAWSQYQLQALISQGVSTGKIHYHAHASMYATSVWASGTRTWSWNISRVCGNYASTPITIKEIGYVGRFYQGSFNYPAMIYRDVLTTPVTVPAGQLVKVAYNIVSPVVPS